jgi:hypothetical protein
METKDGGRVISDDFSNARKTQLWRSPLLVRDDQVARVTADALYFIDPSSLKIIDRVSERYRSCCVWKGTLFGVTHPEKGPCQVDVFDKTQLLRSMPVPDCVLGDGVHVAAAGSSTVYIADDYDSLTRYQIENGALKESAIIQLSDPARNGIAQLLGLEDGRLLVPTGRSVIAYGGGEPSIYKSAGSIAHLCAGASGHVWHSSYNDKKVLDTVVLAKLDSALTTVATLSVQPGRITHMSSASDGSLAIVSVMAQKGWQWTILLLDAKGVEKRRISVDEDIAKKVDVDLNAAFVALTPKAVVLDAGRHGLFGWNAATGARI